MVNKDFFPNKRSREFFTNPGNPIKETKHGVVGADGVIRLVKDGVINLQEQIQSYEPSTNIYNIINNLSPAEFDALQAMPGKFIDATDMPTTYAEALQLVIDGRNAFEKLPIEVKQKFNNDFNQWFATAGSPEWLDKCGIQINIPEAQPDPGDLTIEKEVKE